jgi:hypothetical protein
MDRSNPYEAAFEGYLQAKGLCYVGIDESRRTKLEDLPLKNLDFIVLGNRGVRLLIDVKGRQFPGGKPEKPRYVWENWATQEDLDGLRSWTGVFGPGYLAMFLFMYRIGPTVELPPDTVDVWKFREQMYVLRGVTLDDYVARMKVRSPKWATVNLPTAAYRDVARPFRFFSHELAEDPTNGATDAGDQPRSLESAVAALARCRPQDGSERP